LAGWVLGKQLNRCIQVVGYAHAGSGNVLFAALVTSSSEQKVIYVPYISS
jgi:hypothetical protein